MSKDSNWRSTCIWMLASLALGVGVLLIDTAHAGQGGPASARSLYQQALHEEDATGNLKAAIALYERVLAANPDRTLAAQALVHMADSYQKMGNAAEAQKIYQSVVRDYPDQKQAIAVVQTRLGGGDVLARSGGERPIPLNPSVVFPGTVSADGRFIPYSHRGTGDIFVRDLHAGTDRLLSKGPGGYPVISRDGKQVAFNRHLRTTPREVELVIVRQGAGAPEVRRLLAFNDENVTEIAPRDWSPDGKSLVVLLIRSDSTKIALVSAQDGTVRILKSLAWGFPRNIFFSPDNRYIAYSLEVPDTRNESDVLVMAIDGSRESTVVRHSSENKVMGWSPDGASLLFASDRDGSMGLWSLPIREAKAMGAPTRMSANLGPRPVSLGVTASGAFYLWKATQNFYLQVSPIDLNVGRLVADPAAGFRVFIGGGGKPSWSGDGKYLAYLSCPGDCERTETINVRSMDTDQVRQLPMRLRYLMDNTDLAWSDDARSLTVRARGLTGAVGFYVIDALTGDASAVNDNSPPNPNVTLDGGKQYLAVGGSIVERENGKDRVIFQERESGSRVLVRSSPDRRFTAFVETNSNSSTLFVMPYGGGKPMELMQAPAVAGSGGLTVTWTPDSRGILSIKTSAPDKELWLVPISDGAPRKLDIDLENWQQPNGGGFKLSPDGRYIAFITGESKEEILAIENSLSASKSNK